MYTGHGRPAPTTHRRIGIATTVTDVTDLGSTGWHRGPRRAHRASRLMRDADATSPIDERVGPAPSGVGRGRVTTPDLMMVRRGR